MSGAGAPVMTFAATFASTYVALIRHDPLTVRNIFVVGFGPQSYPSLQSRTINPSSACSKVSSLDKSAKQLAMHACIQSS